MSCQYMFLYSGLFEGVLSIGEMVKRVGVWFQSKLTARRVK